MPQNGGCFLKNPNRRNRFTKQQTVSFILLPHFLSLLTTLLYFHFRSSFLPPFAPCFLSEDKEKEEKQSNIETHKQLVEEKDREKYRFRGQFQ